MLQCFNKWINKRKNGVLNYCHSFYFTHIFLILVRMNLCMLTLHWVLSWVYWSGFSRLLSVCAYSSNVVGEEDWYPTTGYVAKLYFIVL